MYSKELLKGTLGVMILKLLEDQGKMYGYEISQKVKELTDGKILLKDGSLYPALHKLLKDGVLGYEEQSIGKRVRKYYFLTAQGKIAKKVQVAEVKDFIETIQRVIFSDMNPSLAV
jgi:DNA-binding PadR family transcriptional regulator